MPKYQNINHSCLCVLELQVSLFSYSFIYFTNLCWWVFLIAKLKSFHFSLRFLLIWDFFIKVFFINTISKALKIFSHLLLVTASPQVFMLPHTPSDPRSCFLIVTVTPAAVSSFMRFSLKTVSSEILCTLTFSSILNMKNRITEFETQGNHRLSWQTKCLRLNPSWGSFKNRLQAPCKISLLLLPFHRVGWVLSGSSD